MKLPAGAVTLDGDFTEGSKGTILFAHGSGSSRHSPRNRAVAKYFQDGGCGTLLMDLLTREEEQVDLVTRHIRFDIGLLAERVVHAGRWLRANSDLPIGGFGSSTGAAAALVAAAEIPEIITAVVSRGGRPDLAGESLPNVKAPTLMIVGGDDVPVIGMNREAMARMKCEVKLEIVPGATHLFTEPGTLEKVMELARGWFELKLKS